MFSELYGAYYNVMASILTEAADHPLQQGELFSIINKYAFAESILNIEPKIREEKWQIIKLDGTTPIVNEPQMPLTLLQKRWLKAISLDPRIKLFGDSFLDEDLSEVKPLYLPSDIYYFDKYNDGDNFEDPSYISNFRLILDAIKNQYPLEITMLNRHGENIETTIIPSSLEYSEKDDKFRLIGKNNTGGIINLGRIISCTKFEGDFSTTKNVLPKRNLRSVHFEIFDERKALERIMLHFAHFKKEAERINDRTYKVTLYYDKEDETELLIRMLSFGPRVKVIGPNHFVDLIKKRLKDQMNHLPL